MKQKLFSILFVLTSLLGVSFAQNREVTGKVTSAKDGTPISGVSVSVAGTGAATQTDADGFYSISVPSGGMLSFSYIGYVAQRLTVANRTVVNVQLTGGEAALEEVVVTGYGITQKKSNLTSATSSIRSSDIEGAPVQTLDGILQGRAAGVQVTSTSGQPGGGFQVRIRGNATINGSRDPLYVIDGVPVSPGGLSGQTSVNVLGAINPDDIESIEILKDGASAAIYGAQAGNGVVVVTTKKGKKGRSTVRAGAQYGVTDAYNPYVVVNASDWLILRREALLNLNNRLGHADAIARTETALQNNYFGGQPIPSEIPSYDWVDAVIIQGNTQEYNLSTQGGDSRTRFYLSGNYNNTDGTIRSSQYKRGSLRANLSHNVTDKLSVDANISMTAIASRGPSTDAGFFTNGAFTGSLFTSPVNRIFNEDGTYNTALVGTSLNIVQNLDREMRRSGIFQTVSNLALNYQLSPEFSVRVFGGIDFSDIKDQNYRPSDIPIGAGVQGSATENFRRNINWNSSAQLNYAKNFDEVHNVAATGGYEFRSVDNTVLSASSQGFASPNLMLLSSGATPTIANSTYTGYRLSSFFGNAKYDYKSKYLFDGTLRYDGSSRFGADVKFGLFYGFSGGWRLTGEDFLNDVSFLNDLKIRASFGKVGVQPLADFGALGLYGAGGRYNGLPGIRPTQLANPNLTWEESRQLNLGLDFALFGSRLTGAFDIYRKNNSQLLLNRDLPQDSGFGSIFENVGRVKAEGIDIELSSVNIDRGGFRWSTDFNIGFTRNVLLELSPGQEQINEFTYEVGKPLNQIYTYMYAGVNPADGRPMYYDRNMEITYAPLTEDRHVVGDANPNFFGGVGNTFSFKGFSLDILFQYEYGVAVIMQTNQALEGFTFTDNNVTELVLQRWTTPGQITSIPRIYDAGAEPGGFNPNNFSSRYVQEASYIRLKQARLNYALPNTVVHALKMSRINVFVQGSNLLTFTNFRGDDPERSGNNLNSYPNPRVIMGGVSLDF